MFAALPPEVISGQIYSGPGSGSLVNASQAWEAIAADLEQAAMGYRNQLLGLAEAWQGPSAAAMQTAMVPLVAWTTATSEQARQASVASASAAAAFEAVFAEVAPPPLIAANRAQLASLIATNILGQNAPAIAATEALYAQMWAQDVAAMVSYEVSSLGSINQLTPFSPSPQVANPLANSESSTVAPAATSTTTTLADLLQALFGVAPAQFFYDSFQSLLSSGLPVDIVALFTSFFGPFLGSSMIAQQIGVQNTIMAAKPSAPMAVYPPTPEPKPEVKASAGTGGKIWNMRVPPSWAQPQSGGPPRVTPMPPPGGKEREDIPIGLPVIPAVPVTGGGKKKRPGYSDPDDMHYGAPPSAPVVPRHPSGG